MIGRNTPLKCGQDDQIDVLDAQYKTNNDQIPLTKNITRKNDAMHDLYSETYLTVIVLNKLCLVFFKHLYKIISLGRHSLLTPYEEA